MDKMTEQMAIEVIKKLVPKTCKKVDGRLKGGFDDWESDDGRAIQAAIQALEEIQQYRAIGTVEDIKKVISFLSMDEDNSIINDLELLNQYKFLGTVEELQALKEKSVAKKPEREVVTDYNECIAGFSYDVYLCPTCNASVEPCEHHCKCGQHLDWE